MYGVATDITSRKLSELARQASEAFNRGLLDSLADGVFIAQDCRFVFTNPALPAMLGYEPDEFIGLSFEQVIAPEYLDQWMQRFTLHADSAEQPTRHYELQMLCKPAPLRRWVELRAGSIEYEQRPAVLGIIRDIGERKEAEEALADSEARANLMLDLVPEAMLLVDSTGHILRANVRAATLFDYPAEQLQGRIVEDLIPQRFRARHGSYHSEFRKQPTARLMGEGRELTALRRDGSEIPVEVALGPAQIEGEPHVIVTLVDISDRNRAALELQRFVQIVNTSADMLAFVDRDLHYQVVNPAYAAQFGKTPAEVAGKAVRDMFTAEMWRDDRTAPACRACRRGSALHLDPHLRRRQPACARRHLPPVPPPRRDPRRGGQPSRRHRARGRRNWRWRAKARATSCCCAMPATASTFLTTTAGSSKSASPSATCSGTRATS